MHDPSLVRPPACPVCQTAGFPLQQLRRRYNLAALAGQEECYRDDEITQLVFKTWDKLSLLCGLLTNAVIARYFIMSPEARIRHHTATYTVAACITMQALQLLLVLLHPKFYFRIRLRCYLLQRFLRLGIVFGTYWSSSSDPSTSTGYLMYRPILEIYTDMRALASVLLVEPMLSMCHSVYHQLPWKHHVFYAVCRTVVDMLYVAPLLVHVLPSSQLELLCKGICHYSLQLLTSGSIGKLELGQDLCRERSSSAFRFLPAFMLLSIGTLVPSLITYWLELRTKLQYLRVHHPQLASELPDGMALRVLLLTQLQVGFVLCFCIAQLQALLRS
jgi:hypothetical protein